MECFDILILVLGIVTGVILFALGLFRRCRRCGQLINFDVDER